MKKITSILLVGLLAGCSGNVCRPEFDSPELGYVADKEHDSQGRELTGTDLVVARVVEGFVTEPFCVVVRGITGQPQTLPRP